MDKCMNCPGIGSVQLTSSLMLSNLPKCSSMGLYSLCLLIILNTSGWFSLQCSNHGNDSLLGKHASNHKYRHSKCKK